MLHSIVMSVLAYPRACGGDPVIMVVNPVDYYLIPAHAGVIQS